jgi:hypothetical protein
VTLSIPVYLEAGKKRIFAGALDWPGWCRSASDEAGALQTLVDYAPRYARAMRAAGLEFAVPDDPGELVIAERLEGGSGTDFGAPEKAPQHDAQPVNDAELRRLSSLLEACWQALDTAVLMAQGRSLRKGPRGGGREVQEILRHVIDSGAAYLSKLGWTRPKGTPPPAPGSPEAREEILEALRASVRGEFAPTGPRGGLRWTPRYFVRRAAWHILDHAWEIEDRVE